MATPIIKCGVCGKDFPIDHDRLRELVDSGEKPVCKATCRPPRPTRGKNSRSKLDLVLIAMYSPENNHRRPVMKQTDITVKVWEADKMAFGLKGYELMYPDHHRVMTSLVHLTRMQLITRDKPSHYALTRAGQTAVEKMREKHTPIDTGELRPSINQYPRGPFN